MLLTKSLEITHLSQMLDASLAQNQNISLFTIEIKNAPQLVTVYSHEILNEILNNLKGKLAELLKHKAHIDCLPEGYLYIIFKDINRNEITNYCQDIHNFILQYSYETNDKPGIYIVGAISIVNLPEDSNNGADAIEKSFLTLRAFSNNDYVNNCIFYSNLSQNKESYKKQLIQSSILRTALNDKKMRLAFQPVVESSTGITSYYECLLRIINSEGKIVSAGPYIPVAEQTGFINFIDELVLEMAIEELKQSPNITLSFNLSALGIDNNSWVSKAKKWFNDPSLSKRTIIEITETCVQRDLRKTAYFIASLQDLGCQVALDDFGSGYTSFRQLKALSIDIIKIDGAFIRDIVDSADNLLMVSNMLNISKGLGLKTVAEFVENGEIAKLLMELKVDYMQGNYFCPAVNYRSWINE